MAAEIEAKLNVETRLVVGSSGEFTVWVGDAKVAEKTTQVWPDAKDIVEAVRAKLPSPG